MNIFEWDSNNMDHQLTHEITNKTMQNSSGCATHQWMRDASDPDESSLLDAGRISGCVTYRVAELDA